MSSDSASPLSTSTNLLRRLRVRDSDAWPRLLEIYGPLVYGWARQAGLQADDARDVTQEVFQSVHQRIDAFRRERDSDSFRGWLWTIARNKVRDHYRRLGKRPQATGGSEAQMQLLELADQPPEATSVAGRSELRGLQLRAVLQIEDHFETQTWQAFWRTIVEGESVTDVAKSHGTSVWAVYKARSRVLQRIRAELDELVD